MAARRLDAAFYRRDVDVVARDLLGKVLVSSCPDGNVAIRITEVEAYGGLGIDPGSHAHRSRTERNSVMFGHGGLLYVYRSYGLHWCANIVAGEEDVAAAVLLRAGEVIAGVELARARREKTAADVSTRDLARGPGRFCAAAGIGGEHNRRDVVLDPWIRVETHAGPRPSRGRISVSTRTGVSGPGADKLARFFLRGDHTVSAHRPARGERP